jgi:hypothetical protein
MKRQQLQMKLSREKFQSNRQLKRKECLKMSKQQLLRICLQCLKVHQWEKVHLWEKFHQWVHLWEKVHQ